MGAWIETVVHVISEVQTNVAPHVGAWIETGTRTCKDTSTDVAPHVGAWIETCSVSFFCATIKVAPHVGAWIETRYFDYKTSRDVSRTPCGCVDLNLPILNKAVDRIQSHPMWVRGLKLDWAHLDEIKEKSHPMWVRGLKLSSLVRDCFSA